jgi:hypothetical protein
MNTRDAQEDNLNNNTYQMDGISFMNEVDHKKFIGHACGRNVTTSIIC